MALCEPGAQLGELVEKLTDELRVELRDTDRTQLSH